MTSTNVLLGKNHPTFPGKIGCGQRQPQGKGPAKTPKGTTLGAGVPVTDGPPTRKRMRHMYRWSRRTLLREESVSSFKQWLRAGAP